MDFRWVVDAAELRIDGRSIDLAQGKKLTGMPKTVLSPEAILKS
jgi:hypothetical protein